MNSAQRSGFRTVNPSAIIHVVDGMAGTVPTIGAGTVAIFQGNGSAGDDSQVSILGGASALSVVNFGDASDENVGRVAYGHSSNIMAFRTNAVDRMWLTNIGSLGIGVSSPNSRLQVAGSVSTAERTVTGSVTLDIADYTLFMNNSAAATVSLPTAVGINGRIYIVKKISATGGGRQVTVDGNGTETIDGALTVMLNTANEFVTVQSDGSNWQIIGG